MIDFQLSCETIQPAFEILEPAYQNIDRGLVGSQSKGFRDNIWDVYSELKEGFGKKVKIPCR